MKGGEDGWMRRGRAISTATKGPRLTSIRGSPCHWGHPGGTHFPCSERVRSTSYVVRVEGKVGGVAG
jgi:hypothetical protein